jgi:hypothetical protein
VLRLLAVHQHVDSGWLDSLDTRWYADAVTTVAGSGKSLLMHVRAVETFLPEHLKLPLGPVWRDKVTVPADR